MPNTYDLRCPKMADLCILQCAEHAYQNSCCVHTSMRRACISKWLLCAYFDAPSMHIKMVALYNFDAPSWYTVNKYSEQ